jgi:hypothetical protein
MAIKFFSYTEPRPAPEELVGKLVGKYGIRSHKSYSLPLLVAGYSGNRLHLKACEMGKNWEQMPPDQWVEDVKLKVDRVAYVCDTIGEAQKIREAGNKSQEIYERVQSELNAQMQAIYDQLQVE